MNGKRCFFIIYMLILLAGNALADSMLDGITMSGESIQPGMTDWTMEFVAAEKGLLGLQLLDESGTVAGELGAARVEEGQGVLHWDGILYDGRTPAAGAYLLGMQLLSDTGEQSSYLTIPVQIQEGEGPAGEEKEAVAVAANPVSAVSEEVPSATSFWDMNPDAYDLRNPAHQKAIWDLMMQPIVVFDVGQTEHVYPTNQPGIDRRPWEQNCAGELHGQSQGIHVLEEDTDGDGYVLIEAYSNDGTKTDNSYMESIDNKLIRGYVKKSLLKTVTPSSKYALLIDKLRQKLYIFEAGAIIGELEISTGLNNAKQPYNESPAGEFITISKVGEFVAGTMRAQYAIRINGGTLLHEVPYRYGGDGKTKIYTEFESQLGKKASHGCIRIQRRKNAQGQNMAWLWEKLESKTRVFIWNDEGRAMYDPRTDLPDPSLQLYRNPNGGSNYHLDANCSGVKKQFLPLTGDITYGDLSRDEFKKLTPCVYCGAPQRLETLYERYSFEANNIGAEITEEAKKAFGIE